MAKFWRVDYESDLDKQFMLEQGKLAWPRKVSADDRKKFGKQMKVGDGIIMGRLRGKRGMIDGIGRITLTEVHAVKGYEVDITWQQLPETIVMPDKTGLPKWKKYPVFRFSDAAAARHAFDDWKAEDLGGYQLPHDSTVSVEEPVNEMVLTALKGIEKPYPSNITDLVCTEIQGNAGWLQQYETFVEQCAQMQDGEEFVNAQIGKAVRFNLGFIVAGADMAADSTLIKTYSPLAAPTDFWQRIMALENHTLVTMDQRKPFTVVGVNETEVTVTVDSTQTEQQLKRAELDSAWRDLITAKELRLSKIKKEYSDWGPEYITAMLAQMPDVDVEIRPTVLRYLA